MKIAVDVGGVIIKKDYSDVSKEDTLIAGVEFAQIFENAHQVMKDLSEKHELWILSFAGANREVQTKQILRKHKFNEIIPEERWIFVRSRREKLPAMRQYNLDLLIDDTEQIIKMLNKEGIKTIWFGTDKYSKFGKVQARHWLDVKSILM